MSIVLFVAFIIIVIYIPARLILEKLAKNLSSFELFCTSVLFGFLLFTVVLFLIRTVGLPFYSFYPLLITFYIYSYLKGTRIPKLTQMRISIDFNLIIMIVIVVLGVLSQNWFALRSNIETAKGLQLLPFHDASFHLALIGELKNFFPPQNPFFANVPLKNYHFMSDFLTAGVSALFSINVLDLYFRFLPLLFSTLYGSFIYIITSHFTKQGWVRYLSIFLAFFAGTFAYFLPLIWGKSEWSPLAFLINQPFDIAFNWQNILAFDFFLLGTFFLVKSDEKNDSKLFMIASITFGLLFVFKSYAALVGVGALVASSVHQLLFRRHILNLLMTLIPICIIIIFSIVFINNFQNGLKFAPGWTLRKMVEDPGNLNLIEWVLKEQYYLEDGNIIRLAQLYLSEFVIFLLGNLGVRIIGFLYFVLLFIKLKKLSASRVFLISAAIISIFVPIFFNQGGSPYNIIQFGLYALILSSIFTPIAVEKILSRIRIGSRPSVILLTMSLVIGFAIPSTIKQFISAAESSLFVVPNGELEIFDYIKNNTQRSDILLLYPSQLNKDYSYVSALSERRTYYSHERQIELLAINGAQRLKDLNNFFLTMSNSERREFLKQNSISYIYMTSEDKKMVSDFGNFSKNIILHNTDAILIGPKL